MASRSMWHTPRGAMSIKTYPRITLVAHVISISQAQQPTLQKIVTNVINICNGRYTSYVLGEFLRGVLM